MELDQIIDIAKKLQTNADAVTDSTLEAAAKGLKKLEVLEKYIKAEVETRLERGVSFNGISYQDGKVSYSFDAAKSYAGLKSFLGSSFDPSLWMGTAIKVDKTSIANFVCTCKDLQPTSTAGKELVEEALNYINTAWSKSSGNPALKIEYDK